MPQRLPFLVQAVLVAVLGLLVWHVYREWARPLQAQLIESAPSPGAPGTAPQGAVRYAFPAKAEFAETLARPLFHASRRPVSRNAVTEKEPASAGAGAVKPEQPPPFNAALVGIVGAPGKKIALLAAEGEFTALRISERFHDWLLVDLDASSAIFEKNGYFVRVVLKFRKEGDISAGAAD